jgi:hypothetical protein
MSKWVVAVKVVGNFNRWHVKMGGGSQGGEEI